MMGKSLEKKVSNDPGLGPLGKIRPIFHPMTMSNGCQIVHWDYQNAKEILALKLTHLGYVNLHGFHGNS